MKGKESTFHDYYEVHLSQSEKILISDSGNGRSLTEHAFDNFWGGDKLINGYFESKF